MNIRSRHDAIVRSLRRNGTTTIDDLAGEVGASRRTVLRDIGALRDQGFVDAMAERFDGRPLRLGVGLGHARGFVHARDLHRVRELDLAFVDATGDRRGRGGELPRRLDALP